MLPDPFRETQQSLTSRRLNVLHQRLAASTQWYGAALLREVGRNGETTSPRGPTVRKAARGDIMALTRRYCLNTPSENIHF